MSEIRWWWVRHAPSRIAPGIIAGSRDVDCDLPPAAELQALFERLPAEASWLVSPRKRAMDTARALRKKVVFCLEADFVEQDFGSWEGKNWSDPAIDPAFWDDPANTNPPGGESFSQVVKRVGQAIERINNKVGQGDIVAIAHAGPIRAALALALELPPDKALRFAIAPLSLTCLDYFGQGWRISEVNLSVPPNRE